MSLVIIATFRDPMEAQFAQMRLEGSGIPCFLSRYGLLLQVSEKDVGRAQEILDDPGTDPDEE